MSYPAFPALAPVSRSYLMGDHPSARKVAMNGAMFNVLFADRKTSDTLTLTFRGTQKDALEILNHYEKVDGPMEFSLHVMAPQREFSLVGFLPI